MTFGDEIRQLLAERALHVQRLAAIDAQIADARAALSAAAGDGTPSAAVPFSRLALLRLLAGGERRTAELLSAFEVGDGRVRSELKGLESHQLIAGFGSGNGRRWGITSRGREALQRLAQDTAPTRASVPPHVAAAVIGANVVERTA